MDSAAGCFTGDTLIKCVDGNHSMLDIVNAISNNIPVFTYSVDFYGSIVSCQVVDAFKTKTVDELCEVTLSNNTVVKCTPDHKFMMRNHVYKQAKHLKIFDTLMSYNEDVSVVAIKAIHETHDVYDLTVEPFHNFCLSTGVFVHNSTKNGRWKEFQAVLPLRGKILNVSKSDMSKILNSEIIRGIAAAIGGGIGKNFNIENIRYDKVIMLCDADSDGLIGDTHAVTCGVKNW